MENPRDKIRMKIFEMSEAIKDNVIGERHFIAAFWAVMEFDGNFTNKLLEKWLGYHDGLKSYRFSLKLPEARLDWKELTRMYREINSLTPQYRQEVSDTIQFAIGKVKKAPSVNDSDLKKFINNFKIIKNKVKCPPLHHADIEWSSAGLTSTIAIEAYERARLKKTSQPEMKYIILEAVCTIKRRWERTLAKWTAMEDSATGDDWLEVLTLRAYEVISVLLEMQNANLADLRPLDQRSKWIRDWIDGDHNLYNFSGEEALAILWGHRLVKLSIYKAGEIPGLDKSLVLEEWERPMYNRLSRDVKLDLSMPRGIVVSEFFVVPVDSKYILENGLASEMMSYVFKHWTGVEINPILIEQEKIVYCMMAEAEQYTDNLAYKQVKIVIDINLNWAGLPQKAREYEEAWESYKFYKEDLIKWSQKRNDQNLRPSFKQELKFPNGDVTMSEFGWEWSIESTVIGQDMTSPKITLKAYHMEQNDEGKWRKKYRDVSMIDPNERKNVGVMPMVYLSKCCPEYAIVNEIAKPIAVGSGMEELFGNIVKLARKFMDERIDGNSAVGNVDWFETYGESMGIYKKVQSEIGLIRAIRRVGIHRDWSKLRKMIAYDLPMEEIIKKNKADQMSFVQKDNESSKLCENCGEICEDVWTCEECSVSWLLHQKCWIYIDTKKGCTHLARIKLGSLFLDDLVAVNFPQMLEIIRKKKNGIIVSEKNFDIAVRICCLAIMDTKLEINDEKTTQQNPDHFGSWGRAGTRDDKLHKSNSEFEFIQKQQTEMMNKKIQEQAEILGKHQGMNKGHVYIPQSFQEAYREENFYFAREFNHQDPRNPRVNFSQEQEVFRPKSSAYEEWRREGLIMGQSGYTYSEAKAYEAKLASELYKKSKGGSNY